MAARILDVCDSLVAAIAAEWNPTAPDGVERGYVSPIKVGELLGRRVYVFPLRYSDSPASRTENLTDYGVGVVVAERYADSGVPGKDWADERVTFVEEVVYSALDFGGDKDVLVVGAHKGLWTETADVTVYDPVALNKDHLFWSELAFGFNEVN
jgi:hypothetical protein